MRFCFGSAVPLTNECIPDGYLHIMSRKTLLGQHFQQLEVHLIMFWPGEHRAQMFKGSKIQHLWQKQLA